MPPRRSLAVSSSCPLCALVLLVGDAVLAAVRLDTLHILPVLGTARQRGEDIAKGRNGCNGQRVLPADFLRRRKLPPPPLLPVEGDEDTRRDGARRPDDLDRLPLGRAL